MIISASRRTDIPAFYAPWMARRLKEGYCTVPNPYDRNQVSRISLRPEDVDAIVFWTRNPRPLLPYLEELDSRGYCYYFQFTILGYPREIDTKSPPVAACAAILLRAFRSAWPKPGDLARRSHRFFRAHSPGVPPRELPAAGRNAQRPHPPLRDQRGGHVPEDRQPAAQPGRDAGRRAAVRRRRVRAVDGRVGPRGPALRDGYRQLRRRDRPAAVRHPSRQVHRRRGDRRGIEYPAHAVPPPAVCTFPRRRPLRSAPPAGAW